MSNVVAEDKRIAMGEFPLKPGDIVVMTLNHIQEDERPWLGKVMEVYSRNPDPGYTIALRTKEEFEEHTGGIHSPVRLSRDDSMWALIIFATPEGPVANIFHTYELTEMIKNNELKKVESEDFFSNHLNILLHSV